MRSGADRCAYRGAFSSARGAARPLGVDIHTAAGVESVTLLKELLRRLRGDEKDPPPVYVGSHEDKLASIRPVHVDPDDDQPTREDREAESARRPPPGSIG